jgi:hypothetical protein
MREGDHSICLGPRGEEQTDYLNRLGYKITIKIELNIKKKEIILATNELG